MFFLWDTKREEIVQIIICIIREGNRFPRHYYRKKKARDFTKKTGTKIQTLTAARTLNRLRRFNTEDHLSSPTGEEKSLIDIIIRSKLQRSKIYYVKKQWELCLPPGYLLPEVCTELQFCLGSDAEQFW